MHRRKLITRKTEINLVEDKMRISGWGAVLWIAVGLLGGATLVDAEAVPLIAVADKLRLSSESLFFSIKQGDQEGVEELLRSGVSPNSRNSRGMTALQVSALANKNNLSIAKLLIAHGAEIDAKSTGNGTTPLTEAARWGKTDLVRLLISKGADVNARDYGGSTPLMEASYFGHVEGMRVLIQNHADVNATRDGGTAVSHAVAGRNRPVALKLLLENGADPNPEKSSLLDFALRIHRQDIADVLKQYGAKGTLTFSELYFQDLTVLAVEMQTAQWTADICADVDPASKAPNQEALASWTRQYKPFHDELFARLENSSRRLATFDPQGVKFVPQFQAKLNTDLEQKRDFWKRQLSRGDSSSTHCANFSKVLSMDIWDIERQHPDEVATIRRIPK